MLYGKLSTRGSGEQQATSASRKMLLSAQEQLQQDHLSTSLYLLPPN